MILTKDGGYEEKINLNLLGVAHDFWLQRLREKIS
jgi:hypothetical protein